MAARDTSPARAQVPTGALARITIESGRGVPERWRQRRAERKRRVLVKWLRRTANRTDEAHSQSSAQPCTTYGPGS
jgi:hypothetical protein